MNATKTFDIPKQLVMNAYKAVKANAGAAGIDEQSIKLLWIQTRKISSGCCRDHA
jgi:hypothetical protein